jgi:uncharacterized protein (DUF736 family)
MAEDRPEEPHEPDQNEEPEPWTRTEEVFYGVIDGPRGLCPVEVIKWDDYPFRVFERGGGAYLGWGHDYTRKDGAEVIGLRLDHGPWENAPKSYEMHPDHITEKKSAVQEPQPLGQFRCEDHLWFYGTIELGGNRFNAEILPHDYHSEHPHVCDYLVVNKDLKDEPAIGKAWDRDKEDGTHSLYVEMDAPPARLWLEEQPDGMWNLVPEQPNREPEANDNSPAVSRANRTLQLIEKARDYTRSHQPQPEREKPEPGMDIDP